MAAPIRVLVVDDSATSRSVLRDILGADAQVEIVGEALDGQQAIDMTEHLRPAVVTMDLTLPGIDGISATRSIMERSPTPIVVITGADLERDADVAVRCLAAGALTVLPKLPSPLSPRFAREARDLVATVKAMAAVKVVRLRRQRPAPPPAAPARKPAEPRILAIAASTGGPQALQEILSHLTPDFPLPVLIVQHITPGFVGGFVKWMRTFCTLPVQEAVGGEVPVPGTVYLAPDRHHLGVTAAGRLELASTPPIGGFRPSATHLFGAVAATYGSSTIAVVLSGMGRDGAEGLRAVHDAGGVVIAQDERTSIVYGMPKEAVAAGATDHVLPIEEIAPILTRIASAR